MKEFIKFLYGIIVIIGIPMIFIWLTYQFSKLFESTVFEILLGFFVGVLIVVYFAVVIIMFLAILETEKKENKQLELKSIILRSDKLMEKYGDMINDM